MTHGWLFMAILGRLKVNLPAIWTTGTNRPAAPAPTPAKLELIQDWETYATWYSNPTIALWSSAAAMKCNSTSNSQACHRYGPDGSATISFLPPDTKKIWTSTRPKESTSHHFPPTPWANIRTPGRSTDRMTFI